MKFTPRDYQQLLIDHSINNPKAGLFVDMGLGKTAVTLAVINYLMFEELEISRVLIVAPKRVAESVWDEECNKWEDFAHLRCSKILGTEKQRKRAMNVNADIYLINRENYAWLCSQYGGVLPYDMQVFDESSSFRNHKSQRFKAAKKATVNTKRILLLTGTPAPQSLLNLWAQIFLLDRGERLGTSITSYRNTFFRVARVVRSDVYIYELLKDQDKEIFKRIEDVCISLKSSDCISLPDVTYNYIPVHYSPAVMKQYEDFERDCVMELGDEEITALSASGLRAKLLQYSNGAIYTNAEKDWAEVHGEKIDALLELLDTTEGNVLLAYYYKHDLIRLQKALKSYEPRVLKGPQDIKDWNDGKIKVLLTHPASAGHGLNLQFGGSVTIWFGLTDDLEIYEQFNKRLHRSGQKDKVIIHHLIGKGTYDERVISGLKSKSTVQQSLIEGVNALRKKYLAQNL